MRTTRDSDLPPLVHSSFDLKRAALKSIVCRSTGLNVLLSKRTFQPIKADLSLPRILLKVCLLFVSSIQIFHEDLRVSADFLVTGNLVGRCDIETVRQSTLPKWRALFTASKQICLLPSHIGRSRPSLCPCSVHRVFAGTLFWRGCNAAMPQCTSVRSIYASGEVRWLAAGEVAHFVPGLEIGTIQPIKVFTMVTQRQKMYASVRNL